MLKIKVMGYDGNLVEYEFSNFYDLIDNWFSSPNRLLLEKEELMFLLEEKLEEYVWNSYEYNEILNLLKQVIPATACFFFFLHEHNEFKVFPLKGTNYVESVKSIFINNNVLCYLKYKTIEIVEYDL